MTMHVIWEDKAISDRLGIFEGLYQHNPRAAEDTDEVFEDKVGLLETNPLLGVANPHSKGRVLKLKSIPFNIYYDEQGRTVRIMRILHQKRQYP
ncbi:MULTISPECIES: type II toxin-antitoxin system RelE/ParE family toxin [Enterobacterales]|uniref:Plasmid stabilization system protein n=1 Tax=uncultured prokaryote TaxID=198431 RepID=A0A0H5Q872_9ZZZZ|nr:type II toxin-antitoxin system RelE/ParE family toxin [Serratia marcescens]CRY97600.1 hypothetical protein [uncultured prokaryote]